jgi:hypothetical protein
MRAPLGEYIMTAVVSGIFAKGKLELLESPTGIHDGKVRVIVIQESEPRTATTQMQYGKYRSGTMSTEDDFAVAQWSEKNWDRDDAQ